MTKIDPRFLMKLHRSAIYARWRGRYPHLFSHFSNGLISVHCYIKDYDRIKVDLQPGIFRLTIRGRIFRGMIDFRMTNGLVGKWITDPPSDDDMVYFYLVMDDTDDVSRS